MGVFVQERANSFIIGLCEATQRCVQQVQAMNLPEEIQAKFLGGNARRVFRLD